VPLLKPAPDIFLHVLSALGVPPSQALVVEDAEKGLYGAIAAEIPVVIVRTPETRTIDFSAADLVFDSHTELVDMVRHTFPERDDG